MFYQLPNRLGRLRHLQSGSETYKMAFSARQLDRLELP